MYQRILVLLDGSSLGESVLSYARALAHSWRLPLELLHAIESDPKRLEQASTASQHYLKPVLVVRSSA
jgi:nucleotide-binding universal stress UspA family protein